MDHLHLFLFLTLLSIPTITVFSQTCSKYCGTTLLKYPFGSSPGCGDPRFQNYISCTQNQLTFATHTGRYPITAVDYAARVFHVTDPTMSTCFATTPSKGFGLDGDAPFSFHDTSVFALLGCSDSPSPTTAAGNCSSAAYAPPKCDNNDSPICSSLFSCQPISQLSMAISTCCVYTPVDLGPTFDMDLQKLRCGAYTAVYDFGGEDDNPESWKYGVAIRYKFNVNNEYPGQCAACESTNGVCGYSGTMNSFICNCPNGMNTTNDCWFQAHWSGGSKLRTSNAGRWVLYYLALFTGLLNL